MWNGATLGSFARVTAHDRCLETERFPDIDAVYRSFAHEVSGTASPTGSILSVPMRKPAVIAVWSVVLITTASCSGGGAAMTVEQKYEHLRDVANRGADAHYVLVNENKTPTREICQEHYRVFVPDGAPDEDGTPSYNSEQWTQLSVDYFSDSCATGQPREIKTRPTPPPAPAAPTPQAPATSSQAETPPTTAAGPAG